MKLPRCPLFVLLLTLLACGVAPSLVHAGADEDWNKIVELDRGPGSADFQSRNGARKAALDLLGAQEKMLRGFIQSYPADKRVIDAKLRLSHLLATRGDLNALPSLRVQAEDMVHALAKDPSTPKDRLPDIDFATTSLMMSRMQQRMPNSEDRDALLDQVRSFESSYPEDRRVSPLLAEVATLFDSQPAQKRALLLDALRFARSDDVKLRVNDDLHRLDLLGKPVELAFTSLQGRAVDLKTFRGKVVVIYFFASWSPPAMMGLMGMRDILAPFKPDQLARVAVSLDDHKDAALAALKTANINWPVYFDGKGWESPLVRSLGINAIPTVWILDREGNLRTLNAINDTEATIRELLATK